MAGEPDTPTLLITFDDGDLSVYAEAFSYMQTKGIIGTAYVITDLIGDGSHVTGAQLQEMGAAGWAIGNHSKDATALTTLSQAQVQANLTTAANALDALGLTGASRHVAYPNGLSNATVWAAMDAVGMLTGRTTNAGSFVTPNPKKLRLAATQIINTTTLDEAKAMADLAWSRKMKQIFVFHKLVAVPASTYEWSIADFQSLVDYFVAQGYTTANIIDLHSML